VLLGSASYNIIVLSYNIIGDTLRYIWFGWAISAIDELRYSASMRLDDFSW
jgi:hypothetical protein